MVLGKKAHYVRLLYRRPENSYKGFPKLPSPDPAEAKPRRQKACIPRGLPGATAEGGHTAPSEPLAHPCPGQPGRGATPTVCSGGGLRALGAVGFDGRLEARVAYIPVRHFENADLPFSKTKVSNLRYQYSKKA